MVKAICYFIFAFNVSDYELSERVVSGGDMDRASRFRHQGEKGREFLWRNKSDPAARLGDARAGYYNLHLGSPNNTSLEQRDEISIHVSFPRFSDYHSRSAQVGNALVPLQESVNITLSGSPDCASRL